MARVKSMGLRNYVGKLGGAVYYMNKGQNIGRELAPVTSNPRTYAQMRQRMKWANLVNTYKFNKSWMGRLSFESKPQTWSDYNAFMSANLLANPCYLTKEEAERGGIALAPYTMTKGSLPTIQYSFDYSGSSTHIRTNLVVKNSFATVGELSAEIIANNPEWHAGDQLSIIFESDVWSQNFDIRIVSIEIILDTTDTTALSSLTFIGNANLDDVTKKSASDTLYLDFAEVGREYRAVSAVCLIHSRTVSGKTYVSTQAYALSDEAAGNYIDYGTEEALQEAIDSYGETTEFFLDTANRAPSSSINTGVIDSMFGTYQDPEGGSMVAFNLVAGGPNNFKQGDSQTTTNIILTAKSDLEPDDYTLAFFEEGSSTPIGASPTVPMGSNKIYFEFDYSNAGQIEGKAGTYKLYHSDVAVGTPVGEFPVTAT